MTDTQEEKKEEVIEAEIVEENAQQPSSDSATVIVSLDSLIKSHIASIDRLRDEVRKLKQMIEDGFANDAVYQEHAAKAKEALKLKNQTKLQIMKQPSVIVLTNKAKNASSELKEKQMALSDYLLEYQRMTGANEIEGEDGEVREIVHTAKVVRKAVKN